MIRGGLQLVDHLRELGTNARDLPVKRWIVMSMVPAGFVLLGLRLAQVTAQVVRGERDTLGHAHGDPRQAASAPAGSGSGSDTPANG